MFSGFQLKSFMKGNRLQRRFFRNEISSDGDNVYITIHSDVTIYNMKVEAKLFNSLLDELLKEGYLKLNNQKTKSKILRKKFNREHCELMELEFYTGELF